MITLDLTVNQALALRQLMLLNQIDIINKDNQWTKDMMTIIKQLEDKMELEAKAPLYQRITKRDGE